VITEKRFLRAGESLLGRKGLIWKIPKFSVFRKEIERHRKSDIRYKTEFTSSMSLLVEGRKPALVHLPSAVWMGK
jgi:hypothetical protein